MSLVQALGLVAAVVCLLAYLLRPGRVFDWCNACLWPVVALASWQARAWGPLLLNLGFGLAGAWHLLRREKPQGAVEYHVTPHQATLIAQMLEEHGGPLRYTLEVEGDA